MDSDLTDIVFLMMGSSSLAVSVSVVISFDFFKFVVHVERSVESFFVLV